MQGFREIWEAARRVHHAAMVDIFGAESAEVSAALLCTLISPFTSPVSSFPVLPPARSPPSPQPAAKSQPAATPVPAPGESQGGRLSRCWKSGLPPDRRQLQVLQCLVFHQTFSGSCAFVVWPSARSSLAPGPSFQAVRARFCLRQWEPGRARFCLRQWEPGRARLSPLLLWRGSCQINGFHVAGYLAVRQTGSGPRPLQSPSLPPRLWDVWKP